MFHLLFSEVDRHSRDGTVVFLRDLETPSGTGCEAFLARGRSLNGNGELGDGTTTSRSIPTRVVLPPGVSRFVDVSVGSLHTCATGSDGAAYCWGNNCYGQIGDGTTTSRTTPTRVRLPAGLSSIRVTDIGLYRTCGVGSDDAAYCWGYNDSGSLGDRTTTDRSIPTKVVLPGGIVGFVNPQTGWTTTYAIAR